MGNYRRAKGDQPLSRFQMLCCTGPKAGVAATHYPTRRVKRIASINQRQEIIIAIRAMDERVNERCASRARSWLINSVIAPRGNPPRMVLQDKISRYLSASLS
jgi:hypothetical protein